MVATHGRPRGRIGGQVSVRRCPQFPFGEQIIARNPCRAKCDILNPPIDAGRASRPDWSTANRFVQTRISHKPIASETITDGRQICRISGKQICRERGLANVRHRREASIEVTRRRYPHQLPADLGFGA